MQEKPKVSIVVPIYNKELYLRCCLQHLVSQTYENIEIICVDDGSEDNSYTVAKMFADRDNRIILIRQENQGVSAARNAALSKANGDYLMCCDADDYFDEYAVEACIRLMQFNNTPDGVLFNALLFCKDGRTFPGLEFRLPKIIECKKSALLGMFGNVAFAMLSIPLIKKYNLHFEVGRIYEDWRFMADYLSRADRLSGFSDAIYHYRWDQQNSIVSDVSQKCLDMFEAHKYVIEVFKKAGLWENVSYSFYTKLVGQFCYFEREKLPSAKTEIKNEFLKRRNESIQKIPYVLLESICKCLPLRERIELLSIHDDADADVELRNCQTAFRKIIWQKIKSRMKDICKRFMRIIFPSYRVASNMRHEMEQMHGELIGKLNQVIQAQEHNSGEIKKIKESLKVDDWDYLQMEVKRVTRHSCAYEEQK